VNRPGTTEGDESELARIVSTIDSHRPDRLGHARVRDAVDASGRVDCRIESGFGGEF
jgi:hypothetical protein